LGETSCARQHLLLGEKQLVPWRDYNAKGLFLLDPKSQHQRKKLTFEDLISLMAGQLDIQKY
jgi:hypothetical protein